MSLGQHPTPHRDCCARGRAKRNASPAQRHSRSLATSRSRSRRSARHATSLASRSSPASSAASSAKPPHILGSVAAPGAAGDARALTAPRRLAHLCLSAASGQTPLRRVSTDGAMLTASGPRVGSPTRRGRTFAERDDIIPGDRTSSRARRARSRLDRRIPSGYRQARQSGSVSTRCTSPATWVDAGSTASSYEVVDPSTRERVAHVPKATIADAERAVRRRARRSTRVRGARRPPRIERKVLRRVANAIREHADELARLESLADGQAAAATRSST